MKIKNVFLSVALFFLLIGILTGCASESNVQSTEVVTKANDTTEEIEEMIVAVNVDGSTDELPFSSVLLNRSQFWGGLVFQGLLIAKENINNVENDLCSEYTISPDGTTYVFELKEDVYWHDGEKLTAEDVLFSIETYLRVQTTNGYVKKGIQGIAGADRYETGESSYLPGVEIDGNTITIRLVKQNSLFLGTLAQVPIIPKHCLKDIPIEELGNCDFWKMPIGSGPYKVIENRKNKEAVLVLNEQYSGKTPKIEQIRYKVLENPETDYFDFTTTSNPEVIKKYQNINGYEVVRTNNLYYRYLYFNLDGRTGEQAKLLQSGRVRQALAMGIDKQKIVDEIYKGAATVIDSGIPEYDGWYAKSKNYNLDYNPQEAKKVLEEEGFDFSKTLVLIRYNQDEISVKLLEAIAKAWNDLGIKTEIVGISSNDVDKMWVDTDWYDVGLKNLAAVNYSEWYYEYSSDNQMWSVVLHNRPVFNVLMTALDAARWAHERGMLYQEIQQLEREQVFKVPLIIVPQYIIYNSRNLSIPQMEFPNIFYYYDLNMAQWEMIGD